MSIDLVKTRDEIILEALPAVAFDGWTLRTLENAAVRAGYKAEMSEAVFPGGVSAAINHFSDWADRRMLDALKDIPIETLRVRDRIRQAVLARLDVLAPFKEAVRQSMAYWTLPPRGADAACTIWRTADRIWVWAGDSSRDYNRYTKRGLLTGVLSATTLAWINDSDPEIKQTRTFLDRRIENVMKLGRTLGKLSGNKGR